MPRERPFVPGQVMNRPEAQGFLDKIERDTEMWTTKREQAQAAGNQAAVKAAEEQLSYLKNDEYHIKQELDRIEKRENLSMAKPFWDGVYWVGGKVSGLWGGGTPEQPADKAQSDKADKVAPAV